MNKRVKIDKIEYEIVKDYKGAYDEEEFKNKCTDYFYEFDYIVGDIAYDKLRLKGFYEDNNKKANIINKFSTLDDYLKNNCAFDCKYFIAKKNNI